LKRADDLVRSFKRLAVDQTSDARRQFNVKEQIEELLTTLQHELRRTSHAVTVDCPADLELDSDPGALSQVLANLVTNSLAHGFEGVERGAISILVSRAGDHALLEYRDDGVGIPPKSLKRLFEPFFTTKRNKGGSGLGMSIVFNLVTQRLGGEISVHSEEGKGALFRIRVPLQAPEVGRLRATTSGVTALPTSVAVG
jgi:signal transduction histidine kinase